MFSDKQQGVLFILQKYMYRSKFPIWFLTKISENCSLSFFMWFVGSFSDTGTEKRLRSFFGGRFGGVSAVKPSGFRLTKKQDYKTEEESITV